jgi:hypothetical protein
MVVVGRCRDEGVEEEEVRFQDLKRFLRWKTGAERKVNMEDSPEELGVTRLRSGSLHISDE